MHALVIFKLFVSFIFARMQLSNVYMYTSFNSISHTFAICAAWYCVGTVAMLLSTIHIEPWGGSHYASSGSMVGFSFLDPVQSYKGSCTRVSGAVPGASVVSDLNI